MNAQSVFPARRHLLADGRLKGLKEALLRRRMQYRVCKIKRSNGNCCRYFSFTIRDIKLRSTALWICKVRYRRLAKLFADRIKYWQDACKFIHSRNNVSRLRWGRDKLDFPIPLSLSPLSPPSLTFMPQKRDLYSLSMKKVVKPRSRDPPISRTSNSPDLITKIGARDWI